MIALIRFRPYLPVAACMLLWCVAFNGVFLLFDNTALLAWLPKATAGTGFLEDNRDRVEGARREYQEGRVGSDEYLCVILGLSNVREAIPLRVLSTEAGVSCRFLGLGAAGVGMADLPGPARVLPESGLRPDLVLVGVGPHQLLDTKPGNLTPNFLGALREGDFRNAAIAARNTIWFFTHRHDISVGTEGKLLDARADLFRRFGIQERQTGDDRRSPWRDMVRLFFVDHFSEATLKEEDKFFENLGAFDWRTYEKASKAPAILVRLIGDLRAHGAEVVIILMPENSRLRKRMPPNVNEAVTAPLRRAFGADMPPILDLRDAIDDSGFVDLTHLNQAGADQCGRLLGPKIKDYLPHHPPFSQR